VTDMKKRRRQVAWVCFEPYLEERQLLDAIAILEGGFQIDTVSNLIAYITKVCSEFAISDAVRKSLYGKFHELMDQEPDLLIDPLELLHNRLKPSVVQLLEPQTPDAVAVSGLNHNMAQSVAPNPTANDGAWQTIAAAPDAPLHVLMFKQLVQALLAQLHDPAPLYQELLSLARQKKTTDANTRSALGLWLKAPERLDWADGLTEPDLAAVVNAVYTGLCEAFGPVSADDYFHKALAQCAALPEAKRFSMSRFL